MAGNSSAPPRQIPILDLAEEFDPQAKPRLLDQLRNVLYNVGFLYIVNHGVSEATVSSLADRLPTLFALPHAEKMKLSKLNSAHFLGYSEVAEEITQGKRDLREQFDFATELPVVDSKRVNNNGSSRDFSKPYWRLRGPNQWPEDEDVPGFRAAFLEYHAALSDLSYRFVHLVEEAFGIPIGTFDRFFHERGARSPSDKAPAVGASFLAPQHRIKLIKYHVAQDAESQGVGPHKDSSGWLTFLHQVGVEKGLEVLAADGNWLPASPIAGSLVVNFGNAFEAATEGAVRATIHRVKAPTERVRYSIPFFMGLPLDLKTTEVSSLVPASVRSLRHKDEAHQAISATVPSFIDTSWDTLGDLQLRKWIRSHPDVGMKWYGPELVEHYSQ